MGFKYLANKRDFQRQLRARRAAEIANGGGLGTVKLPPLRRNLRGRIICDGQLPKGTELVIAIQNNEVVGLQQNNLAVRFESVSKTMVKRLQKAMFAIGEVRRPHLYSPVVDVCVKVGTSPETKDVRSKLDPKVSAE